MSAAAARQSRIVRRLCQYCRDRKARFRYRGAVRADRDHTLCFQCFRAARDRRRAEVLAEIRSTRPMRSPFADRQTFSEAQLAHRRRMLECLERA